MIAPIPADPSMSLENIQAISQEPGGKADLRRIRRNAIAARAELVELHQAQLAILDEVLARIAVVLDGGVRV